ncbi:MAG: hypothetical protein ACQER0_08765 [Bacillota bacterium]
MEYKKVNTDFWFNFKLRNCSLKAKLTALYLLTSVHRRSEGLFRIPEYYIAGDLDLTLKDVQSALEELEKIDFLAYDSSRDLILIEKLLQHQINRKQQQAALKRLEPLSDSPLFKNLFLAAQKYNPNFASYLKKKLLHKLGTAAKSRLKEKETAAAKKDTEDSTQSKSKKTVEISPRDLYSDRAVVLSEKLIDLILENNPRVPLPPKDISDRKFQGWVNTINKLNQLGPFSAKAGENKGYSWQEIEQLIEFSQQNQFWKNNILSAKDLRKQIIKLENQLKTKKKKGLNKTDMLAKLYTEALEEEKKCRNRK